MKQPYILIAEDQHIMELARQRPETVDGRLVGGGSWFTSYYIRQPGQSKGWEFDENITHPWQLDFHHALQTDKCVVGGFGCGKTICVAMSALAWAGVTADFKFLNVAPSAWQSKQMFDMLVTWADGSIFQERLYWHRVEKPYPKITIKYAVKGADNRISTVTSTLEFMSSADDAQRILTWEGDWINIDQAEQVDDLSEATVNLGTRVRGTIRGRERFGWLSYTANANDNPELWYIFDLQEVYPESNRSWEVRTDSNKNLTDRQLAAFKRRAKDPAKFAQYFEGKRPPPNGKEFSGLLIQGCIDDTLDDIMNHQRELENPLYDYNEIREAGCVLWAMPRDETRSYVVVGDPGQGAAPLRNAPVVMVFDITEYPLGPCTLRAFWWGDGGGQYGPWIERFLGWRQQYHAIACAYDGTAGQKIHNEITFQEFDDIVPIDMGGAGMKKMTFMTIVKVMMMRQRLKWPRGIKGLTWQFGKYELPDLKIAQDIVATFFVLAGYMQYLGFDETVETTPEVAPSIVGGDRYSRPVYDRGSRVSGRA